MNKKIMLLALVAVSALLALPSVASALTPLHLSTVPASVTMTDVGANPKLSTAGGTTVECGTFDGNVAFTNTTEGTMELTFTEDCHVVGAGGETCNNNGNTNGTITTTTLGFKLATLPNNKPGVLVTGNAEHFATFTCKVIGIPLTIEVKGTGVIGTITSPGCGVESSEATIDFNATADGTQEHTKLAGTETTYTLKKGNETAAQDATGKLTLPSKNTLTCT